jgi:hypothetical protein
VAAGVSAAVWPASRGKLAPLPYSLDELQQILVDEVYPVCCSIRFGIAGEFPAFDPEWLERSILRRLRSPFRRLHWINAGRLTVHLFDEWRHTKRAILQRRAEQADLT